VLSGTGSDGALGLKAIKSRGGVTFAQGTDGTAPQYSEMPDGAIATGAVDLIVPVEDMPAHLARLWGDAARSPALAADANDVERLSHAGHEVQVAHSGAESFEQVKRTRPQVAVLDIGMPDMSGYEVAQRIRAEAWGKRIKLIAVTGWGHDDDKLKAHAAGFDFHLTKPIDLEALNKLLEGDAKPGNSAAK
jgi:CheY-like chemotaxis protein